MKHVGLIVVAIVGCGSGAVLLLIAGGWLLDRWASRPAERGGAHRAVHEPLPQSRGVTNWEATGSPAYKALATLDASPVQAFWPLGYEQERTEEDEAVDETPVVHLGANEDWSPTAELEMVPARPLDPDEAADVEYAEQLRRELDAVLGPVLDQLARVGHEESYTCEWTAEEISALVAAGRAAAR